MRTLLITATVMMVIAAALAHARDASVGYTTRGYRYDAKTCSGGFRTCMDGHLQTGWQNAAASSYCSQACGVFPPQYMFDRHSSGNW